MIDPVDFFYNLRSQGVHFFTGVPDSLLKDICGVITDNTTTAEHIISANEGSALSIAAGYHLATKSIPLVYLQNSGLGNLVNPLLSLTDKKVYGIPALIMIGWRGEPNVHDEPQHLKQGEVMIPMLDAMNFKYDVLSAHNSLDFEKKIEMLIKYASEASEPVFLIIRKDTFGKYSLKKNNPSARSIGREEAIFEILNHYKNNEVIVATTGMISREVYECRERQNSDHKRDFLTVGSMGHASQIALGVSLYTKKEVVCIDGDGAFLMHMGGTTTIGQFAGSNLVHVVLNNCAHDSVGGQPTIADQISITNIALACGYTEVYCVDNLLDLNTALNKSRNKNGPTLIEVKVRKGNRSDLGRPKSKPIENKVDLQDFILNG